MTELRITRGLPASGKTTLALAWLDAGPRRARMNRDDLRMAMYGKYHGLTFEQEQVVSKAQHAAVETLLRGKTSVIVDDTNLRLKHARAWADLAQDCGATFSVVDVDTPVEDCISRDNARRAAGGRGVGASVIEGMAERYGYPARPLAEVFATGHMDEAVQSELVGKRYEADRTLPDAWVWDVDGTLAINDGHRSFYDETLVLGDKADPGVARLFAELSYLNDVAFEHAADPTAMIVMSGRKDEGDCRAHTLQWIDRETLFSPDLLLMRGAGDNRDDTVVKAELFDAEVLGKYNVLGVFDDRPKVCRMWRAKGLKTFQVGDPAVEF